MDEGIIIAGLIEPLIIEDGAVPALLIDDDWGIRRVEEVWERFDGPRLP